MRKHSKVLQALEAARCACGKRGRNPKAALTDKRWWWLARRPDSQRTPPAAKVIGHRDAGGWTELRGVVRREGILTENFSTGNEKKKGIKSLSKTGIKERHPIYPTE